MASLDQTIKIILTAVDDTGGGFSSAAAGIGVLTDKVSAITGPLASMTDSIIKADLAAAAIAVTFGTLAVRETIQFQDSLQLVSKQLGDTGVSIGEARKDIEGLGLEYGINANEVAKSVAGFLAAGYDYKTSASLVETSTQLMIAGELTAQTATDALNRSLSGFQIPSNEAADGAIRVGDALNKIGDISAGKFEEIVQGFTRLAPTAKDAGLSIEETAAMVAVLVDKFGSGEIAATALKSGFLSLLDPSKGAADEMARLGVAVVDASGVLRPAKDIMEDLSKATETMTSSQQLQTAAVIFGKEQAGAMNALLGDWAKYQEYLTKTLDETTGATGSMAREVESKMRLISTSVAITSESWRQFLETLGAKIAGGEELDDLIDNVGALGRAFKQVVAEGGLDPLIDALRAQFATLSAAVAEIAQNLPEAMEQIDWSGVLDALGDLGDAFGGLFDGVDLTTVDGLAKAIQAIVDTGETLIRVTAGIVDGLTPFVRGLAAVVTEVNASDDASKRWAGEILGIAKGINTLIPALGAMGDGLGAVGTGLQALAAVKVVEALTGIGSAAVSTAAKLAGQAGLVGAAGAAGYAAGTVLNDGLNAVVETATGTKGATLGTWLYDITHASEEMAITAPTVATAMEQQADATDALATAVEIAAPAMDGMTTSQFEAVVAAEEAAAATGMLTDDTEKLTTATGRVVSIFRDAEGNIVGYGDGLTGIASKASTAAEKTKEMTQETDNFRIKMEEIASNERIKTIEATVSLKIAGFEADAKRVVASFDSIDNSITSTGNLLSSLFDNLIEAGSITDKWAILDQIELENELRKQSFELQQKLAEAEIARIEAQIRAMERGDTAIQIDGTGLEPELEAFMWAILKKIRVKANAEFQDYLLGMAA